MQSRCKFSGDWATRTRVIQATWALADGGADIRQSVGYLPATPPGFRRYGNERDRFQLTAWPVRSHPGMGPCFRSLAIGGHGSVTEGTRRGVAIVVAEQHVMLAFLKLHEQVRCDSDRT